MKTRLLRSTTIQDLFSKVGENLGQYRTGSFSFLKNDPSLFIEIDQQICEETLMQIQCEKDDEREVINCECMFAAFPGMTPYLARDERIWTYLTHINLLEYTRKRWPIPQEDAKAIGYIRSHFFVNGTRGIERANAASRLWWMAHIAHQCQTLSLKEALQCLLFRSDVRANIIERPTTSQNSIILSAILEKLHESYQGNQLLFDRETFRDFMIELNLMGGVKLLDSLEKEAIDSIVTSLMPSN
jgi:hypothetical protein